MVGGSFFNDSATLRTLTPPVSHQLLFYRNCAPNFQNIRTLFFILSNYSNFLLKYFYFPIDKSTFVRYNKLNKQQERTK